MTHTEQPGIAAEEEGQVSAETASLAEVSGARPNGAPAASAPMLAPAVSVNAPLISATPDQCAVCGFQMAADQRYCLQCGERRGAPRLPLMDGVTGAQRQATAAPRRKQRPRWSPNATMIAGVGTLLLAMGVGVLIGRSSNHSTSSGNSGVQVLKVPAGTGGAVSTSPTSTANKGSTASAKRAKANKHVKSVAAAVGGSSSVLGKPKQALPPPTVKLGDKGHGAGYTNGKFTGQFFGPSSGH